MMQTLSLPTRPRAEPLRLRALTAAALMLVLTGCSLVPKYERPAAPIASPMRSTSPDARGIRVSTSISWYLNDDEPLLMTRMTVMQMLPAPGWR